MNRKFSGNLAQFTDLNVLAVLNDKSKSLHFTLNARLVISYVHIKSRPISWLLWKIHFRVMTSISVSFHRMDYLFPLKLMCNEKTQFIYPIADIPNHGAGGWSHWSPCTRDHVQYRHRFKPCTPREAGYGTPHSTTPKSHSGAHCMEEEVVKQHCIHVDPSMGRLL